MIIELIKLILFFHFDCRSRFRFCSNVVQNYFIGCFVEPNVSSFRFSAFATIMYPLIPFCSSQTSYLQVHIHSIVSLIGGMSRDMKPNDSLRSNDENPNFFDQNVQNDERTEDIIKQRLLSAFIEEFTLNLFSIYLSDLYI